MEFPVALLVFIDKNQRIDKQFFSKKSYLILTARKNVLSMTRFGFSTP